MKQSSESKRKKYFEATFFYKKYYQIQYTVFIVILTVIIFQKI